MTRRRLGLAMFWVSALCAPGLYVVGIEEHPLAWLVVFALMLVAILVMADVDNRPSTGSSGR